VLNQNEISVDCGGVCAGNYSCPNQSACNNNSDCKSGWCQSNICEGKSKL
jgi:hypothetical protein